MRKQESLHGFQKARPKSLEMGAPFHDQTGFTSKLPSSMPPANYYKHRYEWWGRLVRAAFLKADYWHCSLKMGLVPKGHHNLEHALPNSRKYFLATFLRSDN